MTVPVSRSPLFFLLMAPKSKCSDPSNLYILLLCSIYQFYHRYSCIGQNSVYRVWYYLWFQASTGGLGTLSLRIRGCCCTDIEGLLWRLHDNVNLCQCLAQNKQIELLLLISSLGTSCCLLGSSHTTSPFKKFLLWLIFSVLSISDVQQSDTVIYIYICIYIHTHILFLILFSIIFHHKWLDI